MMILDEAKRMGAITAFIFLSAGGLKCAMFASIVTA